MLAALRPQLTFLERNEEIGRRTANRHLYKTARWQKLSWQVRVEALFTCAMCGVVSGAKWQTVTDHKIPHRGDVGLFWDHSNLQCLCKSCHDGGKQSEERRGK